MRRILIAGNWKMHKTVAEARQLARAVADAAAEHPAVDRLLAPPYTALAAVSEIARPAGLLLAAQDMHWADQGAFTGAISPPMVAEWAGWVILGHSERRSLFGETDAEVNRKAHAACAHGLRPIVCIGETEAQRDAGRTDEVVAAQLAAGLQGLSADEVAGSVVAYEPVWAIGSGRACDAGEAARVMSRIRADLAEAFGTEAAARCRLLYGGSVKPDNIQDYLRAGDIDGALVGGASLQADSFLSLVRLAAELGGENHHPTNPIASDRKAFP